MHYRHRRKVVVFLALLVLGGWILPTFFSAERYRRLLLSDLERVLQRPVSFSSIHLRLLPRPGFSIANAVVEEAPAFGSEPFAYIERATCDLRWRSLWRSGLEVSRLHLVRPSFNVVRNARGAWNVEELLQATMVAGTKRTASEPATRGEFELSFDEARINFKSGEDKKPFAVTSVEGVLGFDAARHALRFRMSGHPMRADRPRASPGEVELSGLWQPGPTLDGPLTATLRTRSSSIYNWAPLLAEHNPEIYGLLDADLQLTGSLRLLKVQGEGRVSQLHRWQLLPSSDPVSCAFHLRGQVDRRSGRAVLENADLALGESLLHLTGVVETLPPSPGLDLVLAVERFRVDDMWALSRQLWGEWTKVGLSGRMDGLLTVQGSWHNPRYGGFLVLQGGRLRTSSGSFALSDVSLRVNRLGVQMAPARLLLAPQVELVLEGGMRRIASAKRVAQGQAPAQYELSLRADNLPLRDLLRFLRSLNPRELAGLDARGQGRIRVRLTGPAWPPAPPDLSAHAELRAAQLLVPGLTEPLNIPRARVQVDGSEIIADPVVAVAGTTVFTGRLEHRGERREPWRFQIRANNLDLEQGALWFDVLGFRRPSSLLQRLPGLGSLTARRAAASNLFARLNAQGRFVTPKLSYRGLTLGDFDAAAEISGRKIRVADASFRMGGGSGHGSLELDLAEQPGRVRADFRVAGMSLQSIAPRLPPSLARLRGLFAVAGEFETRGLIRQEMADTLRGQATVHLRNISFADFDPLGALVSAGGWGALEPPAGEIVIRSATVALQVGERRVLVEDQGVDLAGARLELNGVCGFDGAVDLRIRADFRRVARRWLHPPTEREPDGRWLELHLVGPLDRLAVAQTAELLPANRQ